MPCRTVQLPDGGMAIVCTRSPHPATRRCLVCHRPESQVTMKLCDAVLHGSRAGETCSRPVCVDHAYHSPPDFDLCPAHARAMHEAQRSGSG